MNYYQLPSRKGLPVLYLEISSKGVGKASLDAKPSEWSRLALVSGKMIEQFLGTKLLNPRLLSSDAWSTALRTYLPSGEQTPRAARDHMPSEIHAYTI